MLKQDFLIGILTRISIRIYLKTKQLQDQKFLFNHLDLLLQILDAFTELFPRLFWIPFEWLLLISSKELFSNVVKLLAVAKHLAWLIPDLFWSSCFNLYWGLVLKLFLSKISQAISMYQKQHVEPVWATHSSIYYIYVCYHQNLTFHKDGINKFPLFDDDKANDHIIKAVEPKKRKSLERPTQAKSNQNNHGHVYLPPFDIIEKGWGRANKVNQGVCSHHHLGNGGKKG